MDDAKQKKPEELRSEPLSEEARDPILKKMRYPHKSGYHYKQEDDELVLEED
jgi:hypothetical protein